VFVKDRPATARRRTVLDSLHRNAGEGLALGQEPGKALALSDPGFYSRGWISGTCWSTSVIPLSLVLFTMVATGFAHLPTFWAIPTEILGQTAAAAAVGMINAVGSVAGFAGPYLLDT
jgi:nitrate/nitrite transporter NarK